MGLNKYDPAVKRCGDCGVPSLYLRSGKTPNGNTALVCSWCLGKWPKAKYVHFFRGTLWDRPGKQEKGSK